MAHSATPAGSRWPRLILIAALLFAFGLRLAALARQNIWWDEARNIDVSLRALVDIAPAWELDIQPPLYYWMLHGWLGALGVARGAAPETMAWAARGLSVGSGVLGVALVAALSRRLTGETAAATAALFAALAPFWLAESQEARMYTLTLALLAAAGWALLAAEAPAAGHEPSAREHWVRLAAFALLSAAALATHYNTVFVLIAWYLWWAVACLIRPDRWRRVAALAVTGVVTALLFAPIAPIALRQIPAYANPNLTVPGLLDYLRQNLVGHLGGYAFAPERLWGYAGIWLWTAVALAVGGLIIVTMRRLRTPQRAEARAFGLGLSFFLVWIAGGLLLYYVAVVDRGAFNIRYSSIVTPALLALLGAGCAGWGRWAALPVTAFVLAGFLPLVRADLYDPQYAREDIAGVTRWLRENTAPGDVILVDQKYPFGFYYDRYTTRPDEEPAGDEDAPARYLFVDLDDLDQRLDQWAGDARRVFWVQWYESDTDPRRAVPFLLNQEGQHAGEQWFQGWSVDWWELNPPTTFDLAPNLRPFAALFPPAVQTLESSLPVTVTSGAPVPVVIRWQRIAGGASDRPLKARVALYDGGGARLAQADERLLDDRHVAPPEWNADEQPLNVYLLQPEPALAAGEYDVRLLVYDAETLEPLGVTNGAGEPVGVEISMGSVRVE